MSKFLHADAVGSQTGDSATSLGIKWPDLPWCCQGCGQEFDSHKTTVATLDVEHYEHPGRATFLCMCCDLFTFVHRPTAEDFDNIRTAPKIHTMLNELKGVTEERGERVPNTLEIGLGSYNGQTRIIVDFGKRVPWIAIGAAEARWIAGELRELADHLVPEPVAKNDVVQIEPTHHSLGGAFAYVTQIAEWGITVEVPIPGRGVAPVRLAPDEYRRVGKAGWTPAYDDEPTEPEQIQ
jgi:hypothetical protein